jgi:hypothetical protein
MRKKSMGVLVVDEMPAPVYKVSFVEGTMRIKAALPITRKMSRHKPLTGIRLHGSDGSLVFNDPNKVIYLDQSAKPGDTLDFEYDLFIHDKTVDE